MTEEGSLPEHADLCGLGSSPSIGLSIRKTNHDLGYVGSSD